MRQWKILAVIAAVIIAGCAVFFGYGYISQKNTANEGIQLLDKKEYTKAYKKFLEADSKRTLFWTQQKTDTLLYEGEALYELERYQDAAAVYDRILSRGDQGRAYAMKALCYAGIGKTKKALSVCDQGIDHMKTDGQSYYAKYAIYAKQKKFSNAGNVIKAALKAKVTTKKQELLLARISVYEAMLQYDQAYTYAKSYVKKYPGDKVGKQELEFLKTRI